MATEIIMPKVDMVMETGTFVEWLINEGDSVEKGQPLFVIMTDKAAIEVESPASGILSGVRAKPDDVIPVTQTIAYILNKDEKQPAGVLEPSPQAEVGKGQPNGDHRPSLLAAQTAGLTLPEKPAYEGVRATPIARRMAAQLGIDLMALQGRGPRGRIHKADVLLAADQKAQPTAEPPPAAQIAAAPAAAYPTLSIPLPDARRKSIIPLAGARKIIAERMAYSANVAPHITLSIRVDMTEAARLRSRVQKRLEEKTGYRLSYTAIIARVAAQVLGSHPFLNASLSDDKIITWEDVHLGIATNIDDYLVVPVIREAQKMTLAQILTTLGNLVERARTRKLSPAEMSGSTFTISNLGMFGIESFTAIINPPETAILAVGAIVDTYTNVEQKMVERPMMSITLSADHRVVDGAAAAKFLTELKSTLEDPYILF
jgi:pyruvate dehydrogenase E2 component (dihydrolipoamide acetyltransferase)